MTEPFFGLSWCDCGAPRYTGMSTPYSCCSHLWAYACAVTGNMTCCSPVSSDMMFWVLYDGLFSMHGQDSSNMFAARLLAAKVWTRLQLPAASPDKQSRFLASVLHVIHAHM